MRRLAAPLLIASLGAFPACSGVDQSPFQVRIPHSAGLGIKVKRLLLVPADEPNARELAGLMRAELKGDPEVELLDPALGQALAGGNHSQDLAARLAKLRKELGPFHLVRLKVDRAETLHRAGADNQLNTDPGTPAAQRTVYRQNWTVTCQFSGTLEAWDADSGWGSGARRIEVARSRMNAEQTNTSIQPAQGGPAYAPDKAVRKLAFQVAKVRALRLLFDWVDVREVTCFDDTVFGLNKTRERLRNGDLEGAREAARASLEHANQEPGQARMFHARAHYNLGLIEWLLGHFDEALPRLQRAVELQPNGPPCLDATLKACRDAKAQRIGPADGVPPTRFL